MFKKILSSLLLLSYLPARADYDPTLLPNLLNEASLIVEGQIVEIGKNTFKIKPIEVFKGRATKIIEIERFENWTCSSRFATYQLNQKAFYFLKRDKKNYYALGAANEGEVPIYHGFAYYPTAYLSIDSKPVLFKVYTGGVRGYKYTEKAFVVAIKTLIEQRDILTKSAHTVADTTKNLVLRRAADEYLDSNRSN